MPKYSISIEGNNFLTFDAAEKKNKPVGFYAVRFVKAADPKSAQVYVMDHFEREVRQKLQETSRSQIRVTQVKPVESMDGYAVFEGGISGTGLMLFSQESRNPLLKLAQAFRSAFGRMSAHKQR